MKRQTQRNLRFLGYMVMEVGGAFLFGVALGLAAVVKAFSMLAGV